MPDLPDRLMGMSLPRVVEADPLPGRYEPASIWLAMVCRSRRSDSPLGLGIPKRLNSKLTVAEIEFGFRGEPSGLAKTRSRSAW